MGLKDEPATLGNCIDITPPHEKKKEEKKWKGWGGEVEYKGKKTSARARKENRTNHVIIQTLTFDSVCFPTLSIFTFPHLLSLLSFLVISSRSWEGSFKFLELQPDDRHLPGSAADNASCG